MLAAEGVKPDLLVCRTEHPLTDDIRKKLALFCNVDRSCVIQAIDAPSIYNVPLEMEKEVVRHHRLQAKTRTIPHPDLKDWHDFMSRLNNPKGTINIGLVGKYIELQDAYISINEALKHAGVSLEQAVNIKKIHSEDITAENVNRRLEGMDILVAPGFGGRGIQGKIHAIRYVREQGIPFLAFVLVCSVPTLSLQEMYWS